jgi:hypothetical protein
VHQHLIPGSSTLLSSGPLAGATGTIWPRQQGAPVGALAAGLHPSSRTTASPSLSITRRTTPPTAWRCRRTRRTRARRPARSAVGGRHQQDADRHRQGRDAFGSDPRNIAGRPAYTVQVPVAPSLGPGRLAGPGVGCRARGAAALRHHPARLEHPPRSSWSSPTSASASLPAGATS